MSILRGLIAATVLTAVTAPLAAQTAEKPALKAPLTLTAADSARYLELGRTYTRWFLAGKADSLATGMDAEILEKQGGVEGIVALQGQIAERAGTQTRMIEQKLTRRNGMLQFWHAGEFSEIAGDEVVIRFIFNDQGKVVGMGINPKTRAPAVD